MPYDEDVRILDVPAEWHDFGDRLGATPPPLTADQRTQVGARRPA